MVLAVLQCWYSHIFTMQLTGPLPKNDRQIYFRKTEVLFSRKKQCAIRTDWLIYSCIFYHLCIMVRIFQAANSFSTFSTTIHPFTQYRKQMKSNYIYPCLLKHKTHHWFSEPCVILNKSYYLSHLLFISAVCIIHLL